MSVDIKLKRVKNIMYIISIIIINIIIYDNNIYMIIIYMIIIIYDNDNMW